MDAYGVALPDPTAGSAAFFAKLGTSGNPITGVGTVAGRDSYLLISSGADGIYFNKDDVVFTR